MYSDKAYIHYRYYICKPLYQPNFLTHQRHDIKVGITDNGPIYKKPCCQNLTLKSCIKHFPHFNYV